MNGPNLAALAFVLLGIGCILLGLVFTTSLLLHGPVPVMETLGQTAPPVGVPGLPFAEAVAEQTPALFWTALAIISTLPAALFGASGVMIWLLVGRPRRRRELREAAQEPRREERLQVLIRNRLEWFGGGAAPGADLHSGPWMLTGGALDPGRWRRLELFLRVAGLQAEGFEVPAGEGGTPFASFGQNRAWARVLLVLLLGMAVFGFLLGTVGALFFDELARMAPFPTLPHEGTIFLLFSWMGALLALLGAAGVTVLSTLDRKLLCRRTEARHAAQEGLLAAYGEHLDRLSGWKRPAGDDRRLRALRALTLAALPGLDGAGKGRLLGAAATKRLLGPQVDLRGADLREADLSGLDLSGLRLRDGDLCRASLERARLAEAELTGTNLRAADLRGADLTAATLRRANLFRAWLHDAALVRADLSSANLEEANLWQADLTGADLTGARVHPHELRSAGSLAGATGPDGRRWSGTTPQGAEG